MRVKKYSAKSMKEALQMVKAELGPEAVILAARELRKSTLQGGSEVEVTAAVSDFTLHKKKYVESRMSTQAKSKFSQSAARSQRSMIDRVVERKFADQERERNPPPTRVAMRPSQPTQRSYIDILDEDEMTSGGAHAARQPNRRSTIERTRPTLAARRDAPKAQDLIDDSTKLSAKAIGRIRNAAQDAWNISRETLEETFRQPVAAAPLAGDDDVENYQIQKLPKANVEEAHARNPEAQEKVQELQAEIERLQTLLKKNEKPASVIHTHPGAEFGIHYELSFMFQRLFESGVSNEAISEILLTAQKEMEPAQLRKRPLVDAYVARWILSQTKVSPDPFQGRTHLFCGPAGSGKTSMLVKWASHLSLTKRKRIAIVSTDTRKVGAVDQLKIYAQILNVPFVVVRNQQDWPWVMSQFANIDHFLVDFPGLQLKELAEIDLLQSLLPPAELAPVAHLVLNCTSKDSDSLEMAKRYRLSGYRDFIFTNLDQSIQHGVIYNLQRETSMPLNSFGIGNRVPEDFEEATKERILDLIFKLTRISNKL